MIKYMHTKDLEHLEGNGDCMELAAESLRLVQLIHGKLMRSMPELARGYRSLIITGVLDPRSPVFTDTCSVGNVEDLVIIGKKQ